MSETILARLGDLPVETFLRDYWQRKSGFFPAALPGFVSPLAPEDLAGLALEEDIESRLVVHSPSAPWQLEHGPFTEQRFSRLPERDWTLLVQAVDHWVPEIHQLLQRFRFIPSWRLDDVMASYAPAGGSVGPHFDYYDVFLVQGAGRRRWQIGQHCDSTSPTLDGTALKILSQFEEKQSYLAKPGDILYIPPGVAHWGSAMDDECITYSIGFRAPSHADILSDLSQDLASRLTNDHRYRDTLLDPSLPAGQIPDSTIANLKNIILQQLDDESIGEWFGCYMTSPKYSGTEQPNDTLDALQQHRLQETNPLIEANRASRFSYRRGATRTRLYVDGQGHDCSEALAICLCQHNLSPWQTLLDTANDTADTELLYQLLSEQALVEADDLLLDDQ